MKVSEHKGAYVVATISEEFLPISLGRYKNMLLMKL
jgi:hypothetical protein